MKKQKAKPITKRAVTKTAKKKTAKSVAKETKATSKAKLQSSLDKSQHAEVLKVYNAYFDNYLKGDVKAVAALLDTEYTQVGSAESEVFSKKKEAVQFLHDTIDQYAGKMEMRNRVIKVEPFDAFILISEQTDLYVLIGTEWNFYSKFRASTLLQQKTNGWKIIHQHTSVPDMRTEEGDNIAIEKISAENIQLRDAIKRHTINLEQKNRELEIEAALEKVRSRSLAMHSSEELKDVVTTVFEKFKDLGLESDGGVGIAIPNEEKKSMAWWGHNPQYLAAHCFSIPYFDHPIMQDIWNALGRSEFFIQTYTGEQKNTFWSFLFEHTDFKNLPEENKAVIYGSESMKINFALSTHSSLGFVSYYGKSFSEEEIKIIQRFGKVFEQAYTRFLELQKAEAQAREAQIEAALERVRSRTMAMHKSEELREVIQVIYEQFVQMNIRIDGAGFAMDYMDSDDFNFWLADPTSAFPYQVHIPYFDHPQFNRYKEAKEKGLDFYTSSLTPEERNVFFDHISKYVPIPQELLEVVYNAPGYETSHVVLKNVIFYILNFSGIPFSGSDHDTLMRFGRVFEQTYTRFNDLKQAEAQTREAKIETALERVRSRSMAMHKSEELRDVIQVVYEQFVQLGLNIFTAGFYMDIQESNDWNLWVADAGGASYPTRTHIPYLDHPIFHRYVEAKEKGLDVFAYSVTYHSEEKNKILTHWIEHNPQNNSAELFEWVYSQPGWNVSNVIMKNVGLYIYNWEPTPFSDSDNAILLRFSKVFEQTYTRFLDLQKAEVQAREAQIENALEKVRSRSLAMHKSDELQDVIQSVLQRLNELSIVIDAANILIPSKDRQSFSTWVASKGYKYAQNFHLQGVWSSRSKIQKDSLVVFQSGTDYFSKAYTQEEKNEYLTELFSTSDFRNISEDRKTFLLSLPSYAISGAGGKNSWISVISYTGKTLSDGEAEVLKRFARVFEQCYTRFQDLEKAEAQTREVQIENALEKVRSRSLAMHKSDELQEVVNTVYERMVELDVKMDAANIITFKEGSRDFDLWATTHDYSSRLFVPEIDLTPTKDFFEAKERGDDFLSKTCSFEEKNRFWNYAFEHSDLKHVPPEEKKFLLEEKLWTASLAISRHSAVLINSYSRESFSDGEHEILKRFAKVFEQAYVRFLDLQKAEAQTREAQIEASLERVRSKAMSMHSSQDLADTIGIFYRELQSFSITPRRCGVGLIDKETRMVELSTMNTTEDGGSIEIIGKLKLENHPVLVGVYDNWLSQTEYHPVLRGNEIKEYYQVMRPQMAFPEFPNDAVQFGYFIFFDEGGVFAWTEKELKEDELTIYRRFTSVLSLTYKRYRDLQKAESNAQEAIRRSSLDRVRAEIASMRTTADLQRITPLVWNELKTLGVPFIRCGVFIMDEAKRQMHTFLSTPEGKAITSFHLPYDERGAFTEIVDAWNERKVFSKHWGEADFHSVADALLRQGFITDPEQYMSSVPREGIHLHCLPFLQGMLYVGNSSRLNDDDMHLVQSLADAFSTAYARYEDFNKLETAKRQVEKTLTDLKQAQNLLVQSEKMASLGQLTAGIAHEIQNPLNFVNNFSELNKELLVEMKEEIEKGNLDEAKLLANDVIENQEKINHHGKRAGDIVKGMLQHSRTSTGVKESTDINALADEYLRLAFHGLRAKDKSFNAKFETVFDENVGKVNVISQDIGRVILNLITNAFYAVTERKKQNEAGFDPTVIVSTKKFDNRLEISVKDNGTGIPQKIVDKIFQPFFTTKPTGQGTGLGLSLSYDIVKAHGGELKVETKEREGLPAGQAGSEFVIVLPVV